MGVAQPHQVLLGKSWKGIHAEPEEVGADDQRLCGSASQALAKEIQECEVSPGGAIDRFEKIFSFFVDAAGMGDFWGLVRTCVTGEAGPASSQVLHTSAMTALLKQRARDLEAIRMKKFGAGVGRASKMEMLKQAAEL